MTESTLLPFYPGDLVELTNSYYPTPRLLYVASFRASTPKDVTLTNAYNHYELPAHRENVKLVRRGNYFKYLFGFDANQFEFIDVAHEAMFWRSLGKMHELRNPVDGLYYTWTHEQAITALQDGTADGFFNSSGEPGMPCDEVHFGGYTFDDPQVARRMNAASLKSLLNAQLVTA